MVVEMLYWWYVLEQNIVRNVRKAARANVRKVVLRETAARKKEW